MFKGFEETKAALKGNECFPRSRFGEVVANASKGNLEQCTIDLCESLLNCGKSLHTTTKRILISCNVKITEIYTHPKLTEDET